MLVLEEDLGEDTGADITVMSMEGDNTRKVMLQSAFNEANPQVSPDGQWLAYWAAETGQADIYVCSFPDVNSDRKMTSTHGGLEPRWSPDGKELFYRDRSDDAMMVVDIETEPTLKAGMPKELFRGTFYFGTMGHNWDIHPVDKKFLMLKPAAMTEEESAGGFPRKINIVLNWFEELKERVPVE